MDWTPLHSALQRRSLGLVEELFYQGADVHARDNEDRTALHIASEYGDPEILRFLISQGALVRTRMHRTDTRRPHFSSIAKGKIGGGTTSIGAEHRH